jgi:hypothetical protein
MAIVNVWFTQEMITATQKNKKMRKIRKKHDEWKTKPTTKYFRECEIYVFERKDWEFEAVLQTWKKSEIVWSILIASFNDLIKLAITNSNADNENYIEIIEKKNKSRIIMNIYSDEKKFVIFANSFKALNSSENFIIDSTSTNTQAIFDDENDFNTKEHRYIMIETLTLTFHTSEEDHNMNHRIAWQIFRTKTNKEIQRTTSKWISKICLLTWSISIITRYLKKTRQRNSSWKIQ